MKTDQLSDLSFDNPDSCESSYQTIRYAAFSKMTHFFGFSLSLQKHKDRFKIIFFDCGELRVVLNDVKYTCQAPAFFLVPPDISYSLFSDTGCQGHILTFEQNIVNNHLNKNFNIQCLLPMCISLSHLDHEQKEQFHYLEKMIFEIKHALNQTLIDQSRIENNLSLALFSTIIKLSKSVPLRQKSNQYDLEIFQKFSKLVEIHFAKHWPVSKYAETLSISEIRLNDISKRVSHLSSKKFILEHQLFMAKNLLISTEMPISSIGYKLGFKDPAYFCRFFLKFTGQSPKEFRGTFSKQI